VVGRAGPSTLAKAVMDWIARNISNGSRCDFAAHASQIVHHETAHRQNFNIGIGAGLMNSHKATIIGAQDGTMYLLELTGAQAAALKWERNRMYPERRGPSEPRPPEAEITSLVLDGGPLWKMDRPFTGAVRIHGADSDCPPPWGYALRCTAGTMSMFCHLGSRPLGGRRIEFSFPAKALPSPGPRLLVFQLIRIASGPGAPPQWRVVSNPKTAMLEFR
jgi:hypothetical protein